MVSSLPLRRYRKTLHFFRYSNAIIRQLEHTPGLTGFSLRAAPLRKRFWTLSVWESEEVLQAFVRAAPHSEVLRAMRDHMRPTRFRQWRVAGSDLPPSWDDALRRLEAS